MLLSGIRTVISFFSIDKRASVPPRKLGEQFQQTTFNLEILLFPKKLVLKIRKKMSPSP